MPIEFLGMGAGNDATETTPPSTAQFDPAYAVHIAKVHEENNWDHVLFAYNSATQDPVVHASWVAANTEHIKLRLAHRPNVSHPTLAARSFLTLDHVAAGRLTVHFITGGSQADQAREGDYLAKDDRYRRTQEYIRIVRRAWESPEPFDWEGEFYRFEGFTSDVRPYEGRRPGISFGGSSPAAWCVGAEEADIYALFGEPLADAAGQQEQVLQRAAAAGRTQPLRWQIAFRPIVASTDELAWEKARSILAKLEARRVNGEVIDRVRHYAGKPEAAGTQRLLAAAERADHHDRALWTALAKAGAGGGGSATALVGSYDTVTAALLDYHALGFEIFGLRGYDFVPDAIEFGRNVIPQLKAEVAHREAHTTKAAQLQRQSAARAQVTTSARATG
ncbi:LLM class flavin-dependent oxidoreductase [Arthrobacter sp. DNA4]|uniref:LLM class flavin-dependent oxidoreductase n=1 Tax=Micrococcaceae TaxID=1268 RepID=UPI0020CEE747|nr:MULTISPECIES: LLM class flavin-dependent oxidoreductase [Micrococcaceae]UTT71264.1 LLM class flavin-dependent oxidoreductase [Arthrobacter sp. DNA4]WRT15744.1 LLM class flavin-dependent oxidoreductase [Pseudarthrobacter sp. LT1]